MGSMKYPSLALRDASLQHPRILLRIVQVAADLGEGLLVDDRAHEVAEVAHVADLDLLHHRDRAIADLVPQRLRDVDAARGRALLPLVFEAAAGDRDRHRGRIRRRMRDDEVLAAGLADQARIAAVLVDVLADLLPHAVEDGGAAGEVHAGELRRVEQDAA